MIYCKEVIFIKTVAIAGTFESKGTEFKFVKDIIKNLGLNTLMIHTGAFESTIPTDITHEEVAAAAGYDIIEVAAK